MGREILIIFGRRPDFVLSLSLESSLITSCKEEFQPQQSCYVRNQDDFPFQEAKGQGHGKKWCLGYELEDKALKRDWGDHTRLRGLNTPCVTRSLLSIQVEHPILLHQRSEIQSQKCSEMLRLLLKIWFWSITHFRFSNVRWSAVNASAKSSKFRKLKKKKPTKPNIKTNTNPQHFSGSEIFWVLRVLDEELANCTSKFSIVWKGKKKWSKGSYFSV